MNIAIMTPRDNILKALSANKRTGKRDIKSNDITIIVINAYSEIVADIF